MAASVDDAETWFRCHLAAKEARRMPESTRVRLVERMVPLLDEDVFDVLEPVTVAIGLEAWRRADRELEERRIDEILYGRES